MKENDLFEQAMEMANAYRQSLPLLAAIEIGLFDVLRGEPQTPEALGRALSVGPRRLRILLDLLAWHGLVVREKGRYAVAAPWLPLTEPARTDNLQARLAHATSNAKSWFRLADALRADRPAPELPPPARDPELFIRNFHRSLGTRGLEIIRKLIDDISLPPGAKLLDVGGGFGDLCRPFLERDPQATTCLFDSPATTALAEKHIRDLGLGGRLKTIGGDFIADPIPGGFDLIILSSILHIYDETTNLALLRKLGGSAAPSGQILIREIAITDTADGPLSGLEFALNMAVNTAAGDAYPSARVRQWLEQSGWRDVYELDAGDEATYALLGRKAG